ncbi:unnamed protein product [Lampetra planeri]
MNAAAVACGCTRRPGAGEVGGQGERRPKEKLLEASEKKEEQSSSRFGRYPHSLHQETLPEIQGNNNNNQQSPIARTLTGGLETPSRRRLATASRLDDEAADRLTPWRGEEAAASIPAESTALRPGRLPDPDPRVPLETTRGLGGVTAAAFAENRSRSTPPVVSSGPRSRLPAALAPWTPERGSPSPRCPLRQSNLTAKLLGTESNGCSSSVVRNHWRRLERRKRIMARGSPLMQLCRRLHPPAAASSRGPPRRGATVPPPGALQLRAKTAVLIPGALRHAEAGQAFCLLPNARGVRVRPKQLSPLQQKAPPNNSRRIKNDFKLWILEARDLPGTGEYFCKISFSADQPCAQTSSKRTMPDVFWGENFEFSDLSAVKQVLVSLYKGKDKHRKGKSSYMGLVSIPLGSGTKWHQFVEQWYTFSTPNLGKGKGAVPTVRIKWRHQQLSILPMERYKEFAEFLSASCLPLCLLLEPALGVKSKEELARALVRFLHTAGRVTGFLTELVMEEVQRCDPDVLFRQNTLASKSVEQFLRLVGQPYLHQVLGAFLQGIISRRTKCEVDPSKCTQSELQHNQKALVQLCSEATRSIMASMGVFPAELRDVFSSWRRLCEARGRAEISERLISASLFLRFLCPAIMSPSLFGLSQEYPDERTARTLTLIAKVVQNLANFSRFGTKEDYMTFMNDFLEREWSPMKQFLEETSQESGNPSALAPQGIVDPAQELCSLHSLLSDTTLPKQDEHDTLGQLAKILEDISRNLNSAVSAAGGSGGASQVSALCHPPSTATAGSVTDEDGAEGGSVAHSDAPREQLQTTPSLDHGHLTCQQPALRFVNAPHQLAKTPPERRAPSDREPQSLAADKTAQPSLFFRNPLYDSLWVSPASGEPNGTTDHGRDPPRSPPASTRPAPRPSSAVVPVAAVPAEDSASSLRSEPAPRLPGEVPATGAPSVERERQYVLQYRTQLVFSTAKDKVSGQHAMILTGGTAAENWSKPGAPPAGDAHAGEAAPEEQERGQDVTLGGARRESDAAPPPTTTDRATGYGEGDRAGPQGGTAAAPCRLPRAREDEARRARRREGNPGAGAAGAADEGARPDARDEDGVKHAIWSPHSQEPITLDGLVSAAEEMRNSCEELLAQLRAETPEEAAHS